MFEIGSLIVRNFQICQLENSELKNLSLNDCE